MARYAQITQNSKLVIPLQYLKKEASDEVGFLYASMKISYIFDGDGQAFPKFPKYHVCNIFAILEKRVRDEFDVLYANKH